MLSSTAVGSGRLPGVDLRLVRHTAAFSTGQQVFKPQVLVAVAEFSLLCQGLLYIINACGTFLKTVLVWL